MAATRLRAVLVALAMVLAAGAAVVARPTRLMTDTVGMPDLQRMVPTQFGDWRVDTNVPVILPSPDVQALLDKIYNQVLSRTYVNAKGQRIMLSIAYGGDQSDGTSAHRPEVCYPAQGFAIRSNQRSALSLGPQAIEVRQLMSALGQREEPITYWVVVGGEVITSGVGQKLAQMRYGLRGIIADGMLVRISNIGTDPQAGFRLHAQFAQDLHAALGSADRLRLFGGTHAP